jgi:1-acyl-sn-glycerol-3-phosphate acyltransferase
MVDIEPMLTYDYSKLGIKTIYTILVVLYATFIYPIYVILNYNIKTEKACMKEIADYFLRVLKPTFYKVSKHDLNISKNIIYMPNHLSLSDFLIEPIIAHYNSKFIALHKMKKIFPLMGILSMFIDYCIYISENRDKEEVIKRLEEIEKIRTSDMSRNLSLYPEGMRRPHRPYVSEQLKKGFIYQSFENNTPIQIIHTTNKDYVIDDQIFEFNYNIKLFTYYSPLIDPLKLRKKFEKREKREYTKEDYYNDFYKIWAKIWKKMDKYRIDSYRKQGMTYDEALQKIEDIADSETKKNKIHIVKNEIWGEDREISKTFIFVRNLLWGVIYYTIYKLIGFIIEIFFKFKKPKDTISSQYKENTILGFCLPKMCNPSVSTMPTMPTIPSTSHITNIINQDVCSPECSPKKTGFGFPHFLMNLTI